MLNRYEFEDSDGENFEIEYSPKPSGSRADNSASGKVADGRADGGIKPAEHSDVGVDLLEEIHNEVSGYNTCSSDCCS